VRAFVAVHVGAAPVLERLAELERSLGLGRGVKWVPSHQKHFTLKFLGDVPPSRLGGVRTATARVAARSSSHVVTLEGLGSYPPRGPARVLWAGVRAGEGRDALVTLASAVESELVAVGFERAERPFTPHLTLGRVRDEGSGRLAARRLAEGAFGAVPIGAVEVTEIVFFQSTLGPEGPAHTPLARCPLARGL
jgi:2'-5' RNA ligase